MTKDETDFETEELTQSETTNVDYRKQLLTKKQQEAAVIEHSLSNYIQELCEKYEVDVSRVVDVQNGKLLLKKKDGSEDD